MDPWQTIEAVARESYGRLVAYLSARSHDVAGAEDALSEALETALRAWPRTGVPEKPEAWLMATARRRLIDRARHAEVKARGQAALQYILEVAEGSREVGGDGTFPDERLKLMFVCAHPAIDSGARTPLMLQAVLGLDAARIASAFLVAPSAMGQRLVRAKAKIRAAGIPFEIPEEHEWPERLDAVLEAIYGAYATGWSRDSGADTQREGLSDEAVWLARALIRLIPRSAEAHGLLSLMLYCESRRAARRSDSGEYIPLTQQDTSRWSPTLIHEAERELTVAAEIGDPGHFQLEAAIQSVHSQRARTGLTEWPAIVRFYDELVNLAPTLGARVNRAAALVEAHRTEEALRALEEVDASAVTTYQPYWAVRAHVLSRANRPDEARDAFRRAAGLTDDEAVRHFLIGRMRAL